MRQPTILVYMNSERRERMQLLLQRQKANEACENLTRMLQALDCIEFLGFVTEKESPASLDSCWDLLNHSETAASIDVEATAGELQRWLTECERMICPSEYYLLSFPDRCDKWASIGVLRNGWLKELWDVLVTHEFIVLGQKCVVGFREEEYLYEAVVEDIPKPSFLP